MATNIPTSFTKVRPHFALLNERAYFDSQSFGPIPDEAFADLEEYRHTLTMRKRALPLYIERIMEMAGLFEVLLNAPAGSVALRESATGAQATIAAALQASPERNQIIISSLDFHSSRYVWRAQERRGFVVKEVASEDGIEISSERIVAAIDARTAVVGVALVSPRSGALLDVEPVIRAAHAHGAIVVLDVYQAVGIVPIDVQALGADVVVGGTHKWLGGGGTGLAFLYVRPELAERLEPAYPGWMGHASIPSFSDVFTPASGARRFQVGFPAMEPIYTARAGLRIALTVGVAVIREQHLALLNQMIDRAYKLDLPVRAARNVQARAGFLCIENSGGEQLVTALESIGIDVDYRPGVGLRVGPHWCHRPEECDRVIDTIAKASTR
jgi:kynureninase